MNNSRTIIELQREIDAFQGQFNNGLITPLEKYSAIIMVVVNWSNKQLEPRKQDEVTGLDLPLPLKFDLLCERVVALRRIEDIKESLEYYL